MTAPTCRVLAVLPALRPGGAEVQLAYLLRHLPRPQFDCELVTLFSAPHDDALNARLDLGDLRVHDLAVAPVTDGGHGLMHATRNLIRARARLAERIRAFQPHVVYSRLWYAGVTVGTLNRRRLPFAHVANEENTLDNLDDAGRLKRLLRRWVVAQADHWVAPTQGLHDQLVAGGAPLNRGHVIHNATPLPPPLPTRSARPGEPVRFAAMGRLVPAKGFARLLDIAARVKAEQVPFTIDVAGEGPERAALEARARALGVDDTVRFVGYVPDPIAFLSAHDAFLLTSHTEGFANVLVEAMACALPTVAFDIDFGPNELIVPEQTGALITDGDHGEYADAMLTLARDAQVRAAYGAAGRERAETLFSIPRMVSHFSEVFSGAVPRPRQQGGNVHVRHSWKRL
ncbi:glycosyltransferase [Deinococcus maricopensis]|uniref:Glycosyl transferase group 1 n=1 Tax=Deinococcus maricopensis (strain DSM 21211 / LMG 22137 / NRRL B-23946 / LB-34) TaxID=709986 RepID=E8U3E9_DEIML|nr:glycosyltransferase [Deinococcus maricopensis]ADV65820.1 glycosyl transferase group 1 [Deinococcus maricopensis DSM 21211]